MTALTATITPNSAGVRLVTTGAPAGPLLYTRVDASGPATVRLGAGPDTDVIDHEVSLIGVVRYSVVDSTGGVATATVTMLGLAFARLARLYDPAELAVPLAIIDAPATRELRRSEHVVVDRADTLYTTVKMGLRTGTLNCLMASHAGAMRLVDLYGDGLPVRVRMPEYPRADMTHLGLSISVTMSETVDFGQLWLVAVAYAEVDPATTRTLSAWSLGELSGSYATLAALSLSYATLTDVTTDSRVTS